MINEIGETAGVLWQVLKAGGPMTTKTLMAETNLDSELLLLGLGWLAREGKILLKRSGKRKIKIALQ